jgi:hypothetical protein
MISSKMRCPCQGNLRVDNYLEGRTEVRRAIVIVVALVAVDAAISRDRRDDKGPKVGISRSGTDR